MRRPLCLWGWERGKMKKKRTAAFALAGLLCFAAAEPAQAAEWQKENPLIAHALGEADGKIETNSKEAFIASWENGYRVVEADFTYTSDGTLVLRHDFEVDGSYYRLEIEPAGNLLMDSKTFQSTPIIYEQTPLTAAELLMLMQEYPDMYLVTDTKDTDKATVQRQFSDLKAIARNIGASEALERIIPQIYHEDMLGWVREIYAFPDWIFTLYQLADPDYAEIADFCIANGIDTVTLHQNRAKAEVVSLFREKGIQVYAHTVNRYLVFRDLLELGVNGIYTDRIKPYELEWVGLENSRKTAEQTVSVGETEVTLTTLDILGEACAPLRQMAKAGKGFSVNYDAEEGILQLQIGRIFQSIGNELLLEESGRLVTKKADFALYANGKDTGIGCYLVDGEVYAPVEEILALVRS